MTDSSIILTEAALRNATAELLRHDAVFFDVETVGEHRGVPHLNTITWIGMATDGVCVSIPMGHPIGTKVIATRKEPRTQINHKTGGTMIKNFTVPVYEDPPPQLSPGTVWDIIRPVFQSERISKVAHGASFDLASVPKYLGEAVARPFECNIVLDWCLNENRHAYGLKQRTKQIWGVEYDDKNVGKEVEKHPFGIVARYLYLDTKYGWLQYKHRPQIAAEDLEDIYALELDILEIMVGMRLRGAPVDEPSLKALRETLAVDLEDCEGRLFRAAGREYNINSTPQKQQILFGSKKDGGQGLKGWKLTEGAKAKRDAARRGDYRVMHDKPQPTNYSTDDEALESFPDNAVACTLREYQDVKKLLGTYVESWLGTDDKPCQIYDGRIHADFVQYGTRTGRFSCRAPNLQNIPRGDTEHGKMLRDAWISEPGYQRVVADYGQIELVMLAHFIGEGRLFDGFLAGIDPHTTTAAGVVGMEAEELARLIEAGDPEAKDYRQKLGKSLNFAVVFGAGNAKVASMIGQPVARAKEILAAHEDQFPEIYAYKEAVLRKVARDGYLRTLLGRKRRVPEIWSRDNGTRMYAERQAFNSKIQGSAADLIKLAMVRTHQNLKGIPRRLYRADSARRIVPGRSDRARQGRCRRIEGRHDRAGNPEADPSAAEGGRRYRPDVGRL